MFCDSWVTLSTHVQSPVFKIDYKKKKNNCTENGISQDKTWSSKPLFHIIRGNVGPGTLWSQSGGIVVLYNLYYVKQNPVAASIDSLPEELSGSSLGIPTKFVSGWPPGRPSLAFPSASFKQFSCYLEKSLYVFLIFKDIFQLIWFKSVNRFHTWG